MTTPKRTTAKPPSFLGSWVSGTKQQPTVEWRTSTKPGSKFTDDRFGRETKAEATLALVDRYLSRTPK